MQQREQIQEPFSRISADEARKMIETGEVQVVDVREPREYAQGHIAGSNLIPVFSVMGRRDEIAADRDVIFVCAVGERSALACEFAASIGRTRIYNLEGGMVAWTRQGFEVEV